MLGKNFEEIVFQLQLKDNITEVSKEDLYLWRLSVDSSEQQVLPCIHRAPRENEGELRLLMIC